MLQSESPPLVLASGSVTRRHLLEAAGLRVEIVVPTVDEGALKRAYRAEGASAEQAALALAGLKAGSASRPDAVVIACDQILVCGNQWFDKPATLEAARHQLMTLRGRQHSLATATVVYRQGERVWRHAETPLLTMRDFSAGLLDAYLEAEGEPILSSVGAYRLEGRGIHLMDDVQGDHSAILGLPLRPLLGFLRRSGLVLS